MFAKRIIGEYFPWKSCLEWSEMDPSTSITAALGRTVVGIVTLYSTTSSSDLQSTLYFFRALHLYMNVRD